MAFPVLTQRRGVQLILVWVVALLAALPALLHWLARAPASGMSRVLLIGVMYGVGAAFCYAFYAVERRQLGKRDAALLVFLVFLLTSVTNNLHYYNVDNSSAYFGYPATQWQVMVQNSVIQLSASVIPHSYRFLPNSTVRWMEMAGIDFEAARGLYRMLVGLVLFYAIYKYARLYCSFAGALVAMILVAMIYPVSYEYYAGQLTDPLSHLSFVLALIFLETEQFAWLLTTLLLGTLAKESVLALVGYYVLFQPRGRNWGRRSVVLCVAAVAAYFGPRWLVLHGIPQYAQISGMTTQFLHENWTNGQWELPLLLTAGALVPVLVLFWKETPVSLRRQVLFLFPVLVFSNAVISWLRESRNLMPVVFVLAVVTGRAITVERPEVAEPVVAKRRSRKV